MIVTGMIVAVVIWMTSDVLKFVVEYRGKITCMVGMMVSITMGMMAGLAVGTVLGTYFKQELFISSILAMILGITAGVVTGIPVSLMAVMDGLMAGLMGGMMGAMLGEMLIYNHPTLMSFIMLAAFVTVVNILKAMLKQEVGLRDFKESTTESIQRNINRVFLGAGSMFALVFVGAYFLHPTNAIPSPGGVALSPPSATVTQDASDQAQANTESAQEVTATVKGNEQTATIQVGEGDYTPQVLTVKQGIPVKLTLAKNYDGGCQSGFVIPDFGVQTYVPDGQTTVTFTPTKAGQFPFSCTMGMFGGTLVVQQS